MSEFEKMLHFIAFAIHQGDVPWQKMPKSVKAEGWKYYYAETRLYVVRSPAGWIRLVSAGSPLDAYRAVQLPEGEEARE